MFDETLHRKKIGRQISDYSYQREKKTFTEEIRFVSKKSVSTDRFLSANVVWHILFPRKYETIYFTQASIQSEAHTYIFWLASI